MLMKNDAGIVKGELILLFELLDYSVNSDTTLPPDETNMYQTLLIRRGCNKWSFLIGVQLVWI